MTGGPKKRTYYLVRKYLAFSADEWDTLPWWQQRMYAEELAAELNGDAGSGDGDELASSEDLAGIGFHVQHVRG